MSTESYLKLLPKPIARAILDSASTDRHAFALACAKLAVEHCTIAVLGSDAAVEETFSALRDATVRSFANGDGAATDQQLAAREESLYREITALGSEDAPADYRAFVKLSTQRHTVRALRAALAVDSISAAARAAFETISAMKFDDAVVRLARETLAKSATNS